MDCYFKPIRYRCIDELVPRYLDRIGRINDAFLSERLVRAQFTEILSDGEKAGFIAVNDGVLSGFYIEESHACESEALFTRALSQLKIDVAEVASFDSSLIALSCSRWKKAQASEHCFEFFAHKKRPDFSGAVLRCAMSSDCEALLNTGYFQADRLQKMIDRHSVYVLSEGGIFKGFGTIEEVRYRKNVASVGAFVCDAYRSQGYGSGIISHMTGICNDYHIKPIAVCGDGNGAFRSALQGAGYFSLDKFIRVSF